MSPPASVGFGVLASSGAAGASPPDDAGGGVGSLAGIGIGLPSQLTGLSRSSTTTPLRRAMAGCVEAMLGTSAITAAANPTNARVIFMFETCLQNHVKFTFGLVLLFFAKRVLFFAGGSDDELVRPTPVVKFGSSH